MNGTVYRKIANAMTTGTRVQTSPKISRFLALSGSLSLFTAHAIIPPMIPKKSGTRYQAEEHTSELQSRSDLVCRLLLEKKKKQIPSAPLLCNTSHVTSCACN